MYYMLQVYTTVIYNFWKLYSSYSYYIIIPIPHPLTTTNQRSVSMGLSTPDASYK